jgi:hypothetical protein
MTMKTIAAIILLVALSVPSYAADYTLGFFTDEDASSCEIYNSEPAMIRVHMIVYGTAESAGTVTFYAPTPACWDAAWLGDEIDDAFLFLGSTHSEQFGISITFTGCHELPVRLGSMSFWASGSQPCCTYQAYAAPVAHYVEVIDCSLGRHEARYESVVINPDESCSCTASSVVSTTETSWGKVKALYR